MQLKTRPAISGIPLTLIWQNAWGLEFGEIRNDEENMFYYCFFALDCTLLPANIQQSNPPLMHKHFLLGTLLTLNLIKLHTHIMDLQYRQRIESIKNYHHSVGKVII